MALRLTEEQVQYFRAARSHLAGPGAKSTSEAAHCIVGAQSQQVNASLWAISLRTQSRPTAEQVQQSLFGEQRTLVRTWGQRDTVHVYDASSHWRSVVGLNQICSSGGRGGPLPPESLLDRARRNILKTNRAVTRNDLVELVTASYEKSIAERAAMAKIEPKRMAAGRLIWRMARQGDLCIGRKVGTEQAYVPRKTWFPELEWIEADAEAAAARLTRDYLSTYGPATEHDIAHFLGATVTQARRFVNLIDEDVVDVETDGRAGMKALARDERALRAKASAGSEWTPRMLPMWDSMLMGHADKSWTVPVEEERKRVWRKSAIVSAVIIDGGRVIATWTQKLTRAKLIVTVEPLSRWRKSKHLKPVKVQCQRLAEHLQRSQCEVLVSELSRSGT